MSDARPDPDPLDRVTSLAREAANAPVLPDVHAEGRNRFLAAAAREPFATRAAGNETSFSVWGVRRGALRLAAAACVALALAGTYVLSSRGFFATSRPLEFEVTGNAASASSYVVASRDSAATVRFSDGSDVVAVPGSQLRVEETWNDGARLLVERGTATAHVQHRARSSWLFVAGPFEVHVTGTKFGMAWDPVKEEIEVTMYEGSVEIDSPIGPSRYSLRAGHRFHASVLEGTVKMDGARSPATENASPAVPVPVPSGVGSGVETSPQPEGAESTTIPTAPAIAGQRPEAWPDLVRRGEFDRVVSAAKDRGVAGCLASCSASDLRALGDSARYVGDVDTATRSLLALRSRFSGTRNASAAAFLLGRTSESKGDVPGADRWYRTYLDEASHGEFAADALAARMRTSVALGGPSAGAAVAREYLVRYPNGVHAATARKLSGSE